MSFKQPVEAFENVALDMLNLLVAIRLLDKPIRLYSAGSSEARGRVQQSGLDSRNSRYAAAYFPGTNTPLRPQRTIGKSRKVPYWNGDFRRPPAPDSSMRGFPNDSLG
nr:hypothetical protein [Mycobacterium numidiamassiliense]